MNINANIKIIIGWVLVVVGLAVIGQTINYSYQYFTAKSDFPQVFKTSVVNPESQTKTTTSTSQNPQEMAQVQIQQSMNQALGNILPTDSITKLFNIVTWSIFATFLVFAGGKITGLGIQLLSSKNS